LRLVTGLSETVATSLQPRVNILGVGVSALNMQAALHETESLVNRAGQGYVCVTGVHGIMEAPVAPLPGQESKIHLVDLSAAYCLEGFLSW
jgi:hypothetical protein